MEDHQSNESVNKGSRVSLPLEKKVQVILEHQNSGKSMRALATQFECGRTQIENIVKRQHEWLEAYAFNPSTSQKRRPRHTSNDEINLRTLEWLKEANGQNVPITGSLVKEKALQFAKELDITTFKASNGWLESFRKRHNITFSKPPGSSESSEEDLDIDRIKLLLTLCDGFLLCNIYVAYEMSIFFKASIEGHVMTSNEGMIVLACANAFGEKETLLVVGEPNSIPSHHTLDCQSFPVEYCASAERHLTAAVFERWLNQFNQKLLEQKRKVILLLDEKLQHLNHCHAECVTLKFLPDLSAPPYDGVVMDLKFKFRLLQLQYILRKIVVGEEKSGYKLLEETSLLHAIYWVQEAWENLKPATVSSWFHKAGFKGLEDLVGSLTEEEIEDMAIESQLCMDVLDITLEEFVDLDSTTPQTCTRANESGAKGQSDNVQERPVQIAPVTPNEVFECIEKLKLYSLQNCEARIYDRMMAVEMEIDQGLFKKFKDARQDVFENT